MISHVPNEFLQYLKLHKDCSPSLMNKASGLCSQQLDVSTDLEHIRIRKMVNSVLTEIHLMRAFVRLSPIGEKVLYGYIKPKHDIVPRVGYFLSRRFPNTIIILGNNTRSWISINNNGKTTRSKGGPLSETVERVKDQMADNKEADTEDLWKTYYWSQYIDDRRNVKYHKKNMPKKHMDATGIKVARNQNKITLDDFE